MTDANGEDSISPRLLAAIQRFDAAYAEWLAARADAAAEHAGDAEESEQKRYDRERAAELALIATPAPHAAAIWSKWELVDRIVAQDNDDGPGRYPLAIVALAALKADIMALGLKAWPEA